MAQSHPFDLLKEITTELVAQRLRSDSAVIARLATLIANAVRSGHSHRSIHEAVVASGLAISFITPEAEAHFRLIEKRQGMKPGGSRVHGWVVVMEKRAAWRVPGWHLVMPVGAVSSLPGETFSAAIPRPAMASGGGP